MHPGETRLTNAGSRRYQAGNTVDLPEADKSAGNGQGDTHGSAASSRLIRVRCLLHDVRIQFRQCTASAPYPAVPAAEQARTQLIPEILLPGAEIQRPGTIDRIVH